MADEEEVAYRTEQIATELTNARAKMQAVADSSHDFNRRMNRLLADIQTLPGIADRARFAESEARAVNRNPASTDNERYDADSRVRGAFRSAQVEAGELVPRIGAAQRELDGLGEDLAESSESIERGIRHLDALEKLPDRKTRTTEQLRIRFEHLKGSVDMAGEALQGAVDRLDTARNTAGRFERLELAVDDSGRHSSEIDGTSSVMTSEVRVARSGLEGLTSHLDWTQPRANEAAQQSVDLANKAAAARADAEKAAQVGLNPQPTDPRIAYALGAQDHRHGAGGRSRGQGKGIGS